MDSYVEKNRNYITSHKLKDFVEDQWTFFLKYIQEAVPPYQERNPDWDKENPAFIVGQAVDDVLTFGWEYFNENYAIVSKKVNVNESILKAEDDLARIKDKSCKTALKNMTKIKTLRSMVGKKQITLELFRTVKECVHEAKSQTLFYNDKYKKAELIYTFAGLSIPLKGELDFLSDDKKVIRDLKTCADIEKFHPDVYIWQMAFYHWLVEELYGIQAEVFLDVIEKPTGARPFSRSRCYQISQITLLDKRREIIEAIAKLARALKTGIYIKPTLPETRFKSEYYGFEGYGRETEITLY